MKPRDLVIETWSALDANRGRSALTVLGIVIGIAAVIAMTALVGGINKSLVGELGLSQAQLVNINVYTNRALTFEDVDRIAQNIDDYEYVTAVGYASGDVTGPKKKVSGEIQGVKPLYFQAMNTKFLQGGPLTEANELSGALVAIIDKPSVHLLFGNADADVVGETIRIGANDAYTIVGVCEAASGMSGEFVTVFVPFSTMSARLNGTSSVDQIMGFAREGTDMEALVNKTSDYLATALNIPEDEREGSIYVTSMQSMIDSVNATMASFSILMTTVAGISLLVGGIGIMNMMLTNVTERIREIGLRKALGARRIDITSQFMLESVCLCLAGGLIGVLLGYVGSFAITGLAAEAFMGSGGMQVTPSIDGGTVVMATSICVGIGMLFGWYPARRAARLDPVESLHYQ